MLTYLKAAAPLIPGASRLPWVAGAGADEMPHLSRARRGVNVDAEHLAAYARVCGFGLRDELPGTYPHVLAFPLHMELMTDGSFPFGAIGLVHIANHITQHRPIRHTEPLDVYTHTGDLRPHPKGRAFDLLTEVRVSEEVVWEETTTVLRRETPPEGAPAERAERAVPPPPSAEWRLAGDLGRRYASVSGDSNPIHLHPLTARLFGFSRAIAHGMWTKARCLAALEPLPDAYSVGVEFLKPILLPGTVGFGRDGERFAVTSGETIHLLGEVTS